jgi:hypothetical protein
MILTTTFEMDIPGGYDVPMGFAFTSNLSPKATVKDSIVEFGSFFNEP